MQRAVTDDARAQQRRQFGVAVAARQMVGERRGHGGEFGVAAVGVPTGVTGVRTQVLVAAQAVDALAAGVPQPRDPDPVADAELVTGVGADFDNLADHLVSGRHLVPGAPGGHPR